MNILFLMKVFEIGGQEVVTQCLANNFSNHGHKVFIACFEPINQVMKNRTPSQITFLQLEGFHASKENIQKLKNYIIENNIGIVINQWGLPYIPAKILKKIKQTTDIKIISIYHNDPNTNARIKQVELAISNSNNPFKKTFLLLKKWLFYKITSASMRYVYNNSDQYQVLSPCYIEHFKQFTGIKDTRKLFVQKNPLTIESNVPVDLNFKKQEVIYVGRIDYNQKRVYRCIDVWKHLNTEANNWKLSIIGDGPYRQELENKTKALNLKNIFFEGFQKPNLYYKRAKVLILTSEFEGFPLVLCECMSFGVVPIVYDSFPAVKDIIQHGYNGYIVPKINDTFNETEMSKYISMVMNDESLYQHLAHNAIITSQTYHIETIYKSWEENFKKIQKSYE